MKNITPLKDGAVLMTKRMEGSEGTAFPTHSASLESALVMLDGSATITFPDAVHELHAGDTFIVPAGDIHQVIAAPDFKAIHIMPKDIRFNFKM